MFCTAQSEATQTQLRAIGLADEPEVFQRCTSATSLTHIHHMGGHRSSTWVSPVSVCPGGTCRPTGTPACDLGTSWWGAKPAARQVTAKGVAISTGRRDFRREPCKTGSTAAQCLKAKPRSLVVMSVHVSCQASSGEKTNVPDVNYTSLTDKL